MGLPHNLRPPGLPRRVIDRRRLNDLYAELLGDHQGAVVVAAAGSGKTVQAQLFARCWGLPLAWLTLDSGDASPSRLLSRIALALSPFVPDEPNLVEAGLQAGQQNEEVAVTLVEAVAEQELLLVVDDCETATSEPGVGSILGACLRYAPGGLQIMLLGREDFPLAVSRLILEGRVAKVTDDDLRLTIDEAEELLATRRNDVCAGEVMKVTEGWVAGVAFWPAGVHTRERSVDLINYMCGEILDRLPADEQQFLLDTSILQTVTPVSAAVLCGHDIAEVWRKVAAHHLPATTAADASVVYHPVFRSFLRDQLEQRCPTRVVSLSRRYADHLAATAHYEEATEIYLSINEPDLAAATAEASLDVLYERADWTVLMRWLEAIGDDRIRPRPRLVGAQIRALHGTRRFDDARRVISEYDRFGQLRLATEADPGLLATAGWAMQNLPAEARRLLDTYNGDFRTEAVRFLIAATTDIDPAVPPSGSGWADMERIVTWSLLAQGRLADVLRIIPHPGEGPVVNPNLILVLILRGDLEEARRLFDRIPLEIRGRAQSHFTEAWLLLAEGDAQGALKASESAITESRQTGFAMTPLYRLFSARALLTVGHVDDAIGVLQEVMQQVHAQGDRFLLEWAQSLTGLGYLQRGELDRARLVLAEAVRSMQRSHRYLMLPVAATYLSEVEAQLGNAEAGHELAALAYEIAEKTGALQFFIGALKETPSVLGREIADDLTNHKWRRLVISKSARVNHPRDSDAPRLIVDIQPFGPDRDIVVDGRPLNVGRFKIIELAAYMVLHPNGVERGQLQRQLFPNVDQRRGGNHFRQIAHKLHEVTGLRLERDKRGDLHWPAGVNVDSADTRFERLVDEASSAIGDERRERLEAALALARGDYLEKSDLPWAEQRRYQIDVIREEALLEVTRLCLDAGAYARAREHAERLLLINAYCDEAYRLLIDIERRIGTESSSRAVYRRGLQALRDLGLPAEGAGALLDRPPH
jgi:ATP/maltotriose-dependent transcriptional regulator MalT/DNA-binding SARP family transcriptional activator